MSDGVGVLSETLHPQGAPGGAPTSDGVRILAKTLHQQRAPGGVPTSDGVGVLAETLHLRHYLVTTSKVSTGVTSTQTDSGASDGVGVAA